MAILLSAEISEDSVTIFTSLVRSRDYSLCNHWPWGMNVY